MFCPSLLRRGAIELASRVDQPAGSLCFGNIVLFGSIGVSLGLEGVKKATTSVALISTGAIVVADTALSLDESIGKELVVFGVGAEGLGGLALLDVIVLPEVDEDGLDNFGLLLGRCSAENVEVDSEPVVDVLVNLVIFGTESSGLHALLERLCLGRGSILV